jgi:hypothetical protein
LNLSVDRPTQKGLAVSYRNGWPLLAVLSQAAGAGVWLAGDLAPYGPASPSTFYLSLSLRAIAGALLLTAYAVAMFGWEGVGVAGRSSVAQILVVVAGALVLGGLTVAPFVAFVAPVPLQAWHLVAAVLLSAAVLLVKRADAAGWARSWLGISAVGLGASSVVSLVSGPYWTPVPSLVAAGSQLLAAGVLATWAVRRKTVPTAIGTA